MPAGFQQDSNQLSPGYYRVQINMGYFGSVHATWTPYGTGALAQQGRVNPYTWDNYTTLPSSDNNGIALAAGNLRWQSIVDELSKVADCQILDIEVYSDTPTDANTDISGIVFTVKYDRNESVFPTYNAIQKYENSNGGFYGVNAGPGGTNGTVVVDGIVYPKYYSASGEEFAIGDVNPTADAIKDLVFRGIARGWWYEEQPPYTKSTRVYKYTTGEGTQEYVNVSIPGVSGNAYSYWEDITVTEINGTTTTITRSD